MDNVAIDFDASWAERRANCPRVRILGDIYTLPPVMPAKLVLFAYRARRGEDDMGRDVGIDEMLGMFNTLLGAESLQHLLDKGIGFEELGEVMQRCMAAYRNRDEAASGEEEAPKGAPAEITGSNSSSSTGSFSSPTGGASTTPTSSPNLMAV